MKKISIIFITFVCGVAYADTDGLLKYLNLYNRTVELEMDSYGFHNPYLKLYNDAKLLEQKYIAALERERSLSNRVLSAAAIGATGVGGMMAASALSEQKADENAERDMRAYIETMRCEYANGKSIKSGETNIELPGGNDMIALYTEYATLASDLKMRKEALGLKPGIESAVVVDKSDTGLYDNAGVGIVGGGYASVYRALTNQDGEDAKMWAEQKEKTAEKLKTGGMVAGVGAIGGAVGNVAINGIDGKGWEKEE